VQPLAGGVVAGVVDGRSVTDSWDTLGVEATAAGWLNSGSGGASTEHRGSSLQLSSTGGASHCNNIKRGVGFRGQVCRRRARDRSKDKPHVSQMQPFPILLSSLVSGQQWRSAAPYRLMPAGRTLAA